MIRVNLLRDQEKTQTSTSQGTGTSFSRIRMPPDMGKKIVIGLIPILSGYGYNFLLLRQAQTEVDKLQSQYNEIESRVTQLKPQIDEVRKFQSEKDMVNKKVEEIKGLSLARYQSVKIMDTLQTIIPDKAWMTRLEVGSDSLNIEGSATEDIAVSSFIQSIDESVYFKDVQWIDSREGRGDSGELVKIFKISAKLENL